MFCLCHLFLQLESNFLMLYCTRAEAKDPAVLVVKPTIPLHLGIVPKQLEEFGYIVGLQKEKAFGSGSKTASPFLAVEMPY